MKIALGQINPTVGDFDGNRRLAEEALAAAEAAGADLLVLPELALSGYPPRDLLERDAFVQAGVRSLDRLVARVGRGSAGRSTAVIVGFPELLPESPVGRRIANSAALIHQGRIVAVQRKSLLPTYDVFDEWRYFEPATSLSRRSISRAVAWASRSARTCGTTAISGPAACIARIPSRSWWPRARICSSTSRPRPSPWTSATYARACWPIVARHWQRPLVFVNQVGGQDDLIFDGSSLALDARGEVIARAAEHATDLIVVDVDTGRGT